MPIHTASPSENKLRMLGIKTVYGDSDPTTSIGSDMGIPTLYINSSSKEGWILTCSDPVTWIEIGDVAFGTSVLSILDASASPPVAPSTGDAYLLDSTTTINAAWVTAGATYDDRVEWSGSSWLVKTPTQGQVSYVNDVSNFYIYDGSDWILLSGSISAVTYSVDSRPPTTADNTYVVPHVWTDDVAKTNYMLSDVTGGIATWLKVSNNQLGDAQDSVLSFAVSTSAPPTESTGDRYILDSSGAPDAGWDGAAQGDIVQFDGATWVAFTPSEGTFCEVEDEDTVYIFITSWVKMFQYVGASFATDSGSAVPTAGGVITFAGDTNQGLDSSGAANTVTYTILDATESQKGSGEIATDAETLAAAVSTNKFLVPSSMAALFATPLPLGTATPNTAAFTYVDYKKDTAPSYKAGRLFYDVATEALSFYNSESDVALQIGEENWVKVRNETGSTITNGQIVYLSGSSSGFPLIVKAIATSESSSMVIGVVTHDIENNSNGYVTTFGLVRSLNTAAFSGGDVIYLSDTVAGSITTTKPDSKTEFVVRIGVIGAVDASVGTFHVNICCGGSLSDINSYTFNDNGFDDPENEVTTSFINGTRTFTITPQATSFIYWSEGVAFKKSASEDIIIPDTEGSHYIYYDGTTLSQSMTWSKDFILKYALVEIIYWDATNNVQIYFGDEFYHGTKMGSMAHGYLHDTVGFALESGAGLTDILEDESGDLDSHAEFGVEATKAYDEDAEFHHSAKGSTVNIAVYYKSNTEGTPYWRTDETASFGVLTTGTGRAAYNYLTGGNWTQAEVPNLDFVLGHVFTYNDSSRKFGVIQGENSYNTIISARDGALTEINAITIDGLIGPEIKFIGTVIYQTGNGYANAVKSRIRSTDTGDEYVDLRDFPFTRGGISGTLTDHGSLTGLADDDHLIYMPVDQSRGFDSPLTVLNGGIGVGTLTDGGLLLGSGTGAITPLGQATNGQIPLGSTGADPVLALPSGTANQVIVTPGAGTLVFSLPQDIHTTATPTFSTLNLGSTATTKITTERSNSGAHWEIVRDGTSAATLEADGSGFYIQGSTGKFPLRVQPFGLGSALTVDANGIVTKPLQPLFHARSSSSQSSVTGDGTAFFVAFGAETLDQNNDFASNAYTSPVAGGTQLNLLLRFDGISSSHTTGTVIVETSNRPYQHNISLAALEESGHTYSFSTSLMADMDAADVTEVRVNIAGGSKTVGVQGNASDGRTVFSGWLIA